MAKRKHNSGSKLFKSLDTVPAMPEGYYSGDQPNPNLRRFVEENATPYSPDSDTYKVEAFNEPITTTKATAIYNMHTYWSKKPHDAIRQYIQHFTKPGDLILDPFCGSGGTALAALIDGRKAIAIDRSPAATFITKNYCTPVDTDELLTAFEELKVKVNPEMEWLYATRCDRCDGPATTAYTVYSQVFQCPRCLAKVPHLDCVEAVGQTQKGKPKKLRLCPFCYSKGHSEIIKSQSEKFGAVPVLVSYVCQGKCKPPRAERRHNDANKKKRQYFEKYDLAKLNEIEEREIPHWYPKGYQMTTFSRYQRDALRLYGVTEVADLFTKRNLWALAAVFSQSAGNDDLRLIANSSLIASSRRAQHLDEGGGYIPGNYAIPQSNKARNVLGSLKLIGNKTIKARAEISTLLQSDSLLISTQSAVSLHEIKSNSLDYIFTDPPYADKVQYGELNFVWEAWLGFDTKWHDEEIIVNEFRGKLESEWTNLMKQAMAECFRVLKPGRWLSLCYHDTSEGTWEQIQDIMAEVGFVVDKSDETLFIDTSQKSYNQRTADKSTQRDLVLNFRKPKSTEFRTRVIEPGTFVDLAAGTIRDFLTSHPGSAKDRIYDAVVSRAVQRGRMEAFDFETLLRSLAEVSELRWYLKETADQIDHAEEAKEDAAAKRLAKFISDYLKKNPELEGVHYSDLFEQYLPVHDKPRRLLNDWLPEYFIKTASGTWRLPDEEESQVLAKLREAGTLRRIKRFANALIDGVPVREKDRPGSDVDLLDWLRQCRRAGLYEQGRAIYEKGGLNSANLTDEQQIEAEDDYRICVRRGSSEEAKPKRQSKKKSQDDE